MDLVVPVPVKVVRMQGDVAHLGRGDSVSDVRVHGTTHERPIDRFARETLTPLGHQPPYHYTAPRRRIAAADALVAIAAGR